MSGKAANGGAHGGTAPRFRSGANSRTHVQFEMPKNRTPPRVLRERDVPGVTEPYRNSAGVDAAVRTRIYRCEGSAVSDSSASAHPGSVLGGVDWLNDDGYGGLLCP